MIAADCSAVRLPAGARAASTTFCGKPKIQRLGAAGHVEPEFADQMFSVELLLQSKTQVQPFVIAQWLFRVLNVTMCRETPGAPAIAQPFGPLVNLAIDRSGSSIKSPVAKNPRALQQTWRTSPLNSCRRPISSRIRSRQNCRLSISRAEFRQRVIRQHLQHDTR